MYVPATEEVCRLKIKNLIHVLSFLIIGTVLFLEIQTILSQKWYYPAYLEARFDMVKEFTEIADRANLQAVFLGSSHPECGIDCMTIYECRKITTYNLSTSVQPLPVSCYFLNEVFEKQNPQIVLLDASLLFRHSFNDPGWRIALDLTPFSQNKIGLTTEYASQHSEDNRLGSFISNIFPIYWYHDRWPKLTVSDFERPEKRRNYYCKGSRITNVITPTFDVLDQFNETARQLVENVDWSNDMANGAYNDLMETAALYDPSIDDASLDYMLKIKLLCEQHNAKLVLIKIPAIGYPQYYEGAWTQLRSNAVKEMAEQYNLEFLDLLYDYDLGIDWDRDSSDGGHHLNYLGAQKVSSFIADYLAEEQGLTGSVCQAYEEDLPIYNEVCRLSDLQTTQHLKEHLELLKQLDNVTVFFSASDDMMGSLSLEDRQAFREFGILTDFNSLGYRDAFLAVMENGELRSDRSSSRRIADEGTLTNGCTYAISSCGWLAGSESTIIIDGVDYSLNRRGINIVVLDNASGLVLDSVAFDTSDVPENQSAFRDNGRTETFLREYEQYLMIEDAKNGIGG